MTTQMTNLMRILTMILMTDHCRPISCLTSSCVLPAMNIAGDISAAATSFCLSLGSLQTHVPMLHKCLWKACSNIEADIDNVQRCMEMRSNEQQLKCNERAES